MGATSSESCLSVCMTKASEHPGSQDRAMSVTVCVCDVPESCLGSDDFLSYKHFVSRQLFDEQMTEEMEELELGQFSALDPEKRGQIEWADFLYHESIRVLEKFRSQVNHSQVLSVCIHQ